MNKKRKKQKKFVLVLLIIVTVVAIGLVLAAKQNQTDKPVELIELEQQIEEANAGKEFDLQYEYRGPNTHQSLPFKYDQNE